MLEFSEFLALDFVLFVAGPKGQNEIDACSGQLCTTQNEREIAKTVCWADDCRLWTAEVENDESSARRGQ